MFSSTSTVTATATTTATSTSTETTSNSDLSNYSNIEQWCEAQVDYINELSDHFDHLVRDEIPNIQKFQTQLARNELDEIETSAYLDQIAFMVSKVGIENVNKLLDNKLKEIKREQSISNGKQHHRGTFDHNGHDHDHCQHHKHLDIIESSNIENLRGFIKAIIEIDKILAQET